MKLVSASLSKNHANATLFEIKGNACSSDRFNHLAHKHPGTRTRIKSRMHVVIFEFRSNIFDSRALLQSPICLQKKLSALRLLTKLIYAYSMALHCSSASSYQSALSNLSLMPAQAKLAFHWNPKKSRYPIWITRFLCPMNLLPS